MFYEFVRWLTRFLLLLLTDCRVIGTENVPPSGALIVLSNHLSNVDPPLVGSLVPRTVRFVAKEELFKIALFGWCVRWYGALPLRRGTVDRRAIRQALDILRQGGVVGMFPEGHRSRGGQLQRGQAGATLLALLSGAPLLPVAIIGSHHAVRRLWSRPRIDFIIGPVFHLEVGKANPGREELERLTDEMMLHIAELLPEELRGRYRGRQPSDGGAATAAGLVKDLAADS